LVNCVYRHGDKKQYNHEKQILSLAKFCNSQSQTYFDKITQYCRRGVGHQANANIYTDGYDNTYKSKVKVCRSDRDDEVLLQFDIPCERTDFPYLQNLFESERTYGVSFPGSPFPRAEVDRFLFNGRNYIELGNTRDGLYFIRFFSNTIRFIEEDDDFDLDDLEDAQFGFGF
jgi:hypothetical protein